MRLRSALLAAVALGVALPAAAQTVLPELAPCLEASDQAFCLLKLAAVPDGGASLARDSELATHPELLAAVGVTPGDLAAYYATDAGRISQLFFGPVDRARTAMAQVLEADRGGRPPAEALKPLTAFPAEEPAPPLFFSRGEKESVPLIVYGWLAQNTEISPGLDAAVMQAWEQDLTKRAPLGGNLTDPSWLAAAYATRGDEAGVDRAVALETNPAARIQILSDLKRYSLAAEAAAKLTTSEIEPSIRVEMQRLVEAARVERAAAEAAAGPFLQELAAQASPPPTRAELRKMRKLLKARPQDDLPTMSEDEIRDTARSRLESLRRDIIVRAIQDHRAQEAHVLADGLLNAHPPALASDDSLMGAVVWVQAATPSIAQTWLAGLEATLPAQLTPGRAAFRDGRILTLANARRVLGQTDKLDALIVRLRPAAAAERAQDASFDPVRQPNAQVLGQILVSADRIDEAYALGSVAPEDLLRADIARGRGVARLDRYLAMAADENGRIRVLNLCASTTRIRGSFRDVLACQRRSYDILTAPQQRLFLAGSALEGAGAAANGDDLPSARALFRLALHAGLPALNADPTVATGSEPVNRAHLIAIAKAELRADGRLPPPPRAQTVIGPAP